MVLRKMVTSQRRDSNGREVDNELGSTWKAWNIEAAAVAVVDHSSYYRDAGDVGGDNEESVQHEEVPKA